MNLHDDLRICVPQGPGQWRRAGELVADYGASLGVDLGFQDFDQECADMAAVYGQPGAHFLMVSSGDDCLGCGGFLPLPHDVAPGACEMRRLYVVPAHRRRGLGRLLAEALMQAAADAGHGLMYLDALSDMAAARELYAGLGFEPTEPYYYNPLPGAHYFCASLSGAPSRY